MKTSITKGLDPEEAAEIEQAFVAAARLRHRMIDLLNEKITLNSKDMRSKTNYESNAWPMLQADGIGYERALYEVISLFLSKNDEK